MQPAILVLNAGSSSLKFALFDAAGDALAPRLRGQVSGIRSTPRFSLQGDVGGDDPGMLATGELPAIDNHHDAIDFVLDRLQAHGAGSHLAGAGHRVVHGGALRAEPARVDAALMDELDALCPLAQLHQPYNLAAIRALQARAPALPQVACFDTAFHASLPAGARLLPLPAELRARGLQRYGFHGLSYEHVVGLLRRDGELPRRLLVAHLGNGGSLCAIRDGRSRATTMGFSTLDGLLMGTRSGSLDPGVLLYLMREHGLGADELTDLLYDNRSGLLGVSGLSGDMRVLLASDAPDAVAAVELYCDTLIRGIGSMAAALGGIDMLVFTGGVGENAAEIRARVCRSLDWLGLAFDEAANAAGETRLTRPGSALEARVVRADEEEVIAAHTRRLLAL